jgi:hypothetical protein
MMEIIPETRRMAAMEPRLKKSFTLIEGRLSPLFLNHFISVRIQFYKTYICEGYSRGRHLKATVPFSTPISLRASIEHPYASSRVLLFSLK